MADDQQGKKPSEITNARIMVWIIVAGIGIYLVATGIAGIIAKG